MAAKFYAKGPGNEGYVKNLDVMAFDDLDGGTFFQMALHKTTKGQYYVYGTMRDSIGIIAPSHVWIRGPNRGQEITRRRAL